MLRPAADSSIIKGLEKTLLKHAMDGAWKSVVTVGLVASTGVCALSLVRRHQQPQRNPLCNFQDVGQGVLIRDVPATPAAVVEELKSYQNTRSALFYGWLGSRGEGTQALAK